MPFSHLHSVGESFLFSICCTGALPNGGIQFAQPVASISSLAQAQAAAAAAAVSMSGLQTMPSNPAVAGFGAPITYLPPTGGKHYIITNSIYHVCFSHTCLY